MWSSPNTSDTFNPVFKRNTSSSMPLSNEKLASSCVDVASCGGDSILMDKLFVHPQYTMKEKEQDV